MTIKRVTFHQNYFGKKSTEIFETIIFPNTLFPTKKMQNQYTSIKNTVKYSDVSHSRFSIWFNFILFQEFRYYFSPLSRCFLHMEQIAATMNTFVLWPHWKIQPENFQFWIRRNFKFEIHIWWLYEFLILYFWIRFIASNLSP